MICHNAKGEMCSADDPDRLVWFGDCGYWTDNWELLYKSGMIQPSYHCPRCNAKLHSFSASIWDEGVENWNSDYPGYDKWINDNKEVCFGNSSEYDYALLSKGFLDITE